MDERIQELLEGFSDGDYVRAVYGSKDTLIAYIGTIQKVGKFSIVLKTDAGDLQKVPLDELFRNLERIKTENRIPIPPVPPNPPENVNKGFQNNVFQNHRQMVKLQAAQPYHFDIQEWIGTIRAMLKQSENVGFKQSVHGILDSLTASIKDRALNYKYHNLRARLHQQWECCADKIDFEIFYLTMGILAVGAEDYSYALEPLVRANKFTLAAYAATVGQRAKDAEVFTVCALLANETGASFNQFTSDICINRRDAAVLELLLDQNRDDSQICECVAACANAMYQESGGKLTADITPYFTAQQAAAALLAAVPAGWKQDSAIKVRWDEFSRYTYPVQTVSNVDTAPVYGVGAISDFVVGENKNYGRISPNEFFHVRQVNDRTEEGLLLRKLLAVGLANGLEVSYTLGQSWSNPDKSAASDVALTSRGYEQAQRLIAAGGRQSSILKGCIESYDVYTEQGSILANGVRYKFGLNNIVDPYLRAYHRESFRPQAQNVTFEVNGRKAVNICWHEPSKDDWEAYAGTVTAKMQEDWENFQKYRKEEEKEIELPSGDPFDTFPFVLLDDWRPPAKIRPAALTWGNLDAPPPVKVEKPKPIVREPVVVDLIPMLDGKTYADRARKYATIGKYDQAESEFENALKYGGFNDRVVNDYVMMSLKANKGDHAVQLLDRFASQFPPEKLLTMRIQVYDKIKDYHRLCPLYEEAVSSSASVARRSHYLIQLIGIYIKLGLYDKALDACIRWESFYSQNRYSTDAEKMKRAAPGVERQKAICYYHTGKLEEARRIAINVIRANPADEVANGILNGTLRRTVEDPSPAEEERIDDDDPFADDDEVKGNTAQMSRFVRSKIQQADISTNIRSNKMKDGKYTGTLAEAVDEIRRQLTGRRTFGTVRARSDMLFAACKLLEQVEQQADGDARGRNYKYRLAGRAMASWGDYMVSQSSQIDTPRMAYLSTMKLLMPSKKGMEQDWPNVFNRYLRSFFMAKVGNESLEAYISQQQRAAANTDILAEKTIPDVLIPEFLVGMLKFLNALEKYPEQRKNLIDDLYQKNSGLRRALCSQLNDFMGEPVEEDISKAEFSKLMVRACEKLNGNIEALNADLVEVSSQLMLRKVSSEMVDRLHPVLWVDSLTATDAARLGRIVYVIKRAQDYYESSDFDNRADCLRAAILEIKDLQQIIQNEPTDVSFDVFLPALDQMALKLSDKETSLYQNFQPKLSWSETMPPFRTPDGKIEIHLTVENEVNYQTADSLCIESVRGPEIVTFDKGTSIESLRGGERREISLVVTIEKDANENGSFYAVIGCSYKCNESPENVIGRSQEREFSFVIYQEDVKELINPFDSYEGKPMSDETMFFGREDQIQRMAKTIGSVEDGTMNYGRAIAMYGQTRTGKSSLMFHLKERIRKEYGDRVLIWDMGNLCMLPVERSTEFMALFLRRMLVKGRDAIWDNDRIAARVEEAGLEPPLSEMRTRPENALEYFNEYMTALDAIIRQENTSIVLMIDEFTYLHTMIRCGKLGTDFMHFWKALLQNYRVFAIVTGLDNTPEFMREYPNDFACMELMKLNYLDEEAAKNLIRVPLEKKNDRADLFTDESCIDMLYDLTAGNPNLTILLCARLVRYLNNRGARFVTSGIVDDFLRTKVLSPDSVLEDYYFEPQLQEYGHPELNDANREVLLSIARLSQTTGYACLEDIECAGKTADEIRELVDRLVDRNVLVKEGRDNYWIQVRLLEKWLIQKNGA